MPLVVVRFSNESSMSPMHAKAHVSVEPKHDTCGTCGRRCCICTSEFGTPALMIVRSAERSASGKRGWLSTGIQIV